MAETIRFHLNSKPVELETAGDRSLLWVLRADLGLTGAKYGCGASLCGACTVLVDNKAVRSCRLPLKAIEGKRVVTIEGLVQDGKLHPLQSAFAEHDALQCGFCTPGMILTAYGLLQNRANASREEIIRHMNGNLCRCGSYERIIAAIQTAARALQGGKS